MSQSCLCLFVLSLLTMDGKDPRSLYCHGNLLLAISLNSEAHSPYIYYQMKSPMIDGTGYQGPLRTDLLREKYK